MYNTQTLSQDPDEITKKVLTIISQKIGVSQDSINLEDHLFDDLNSSKLEKAEIIASLENAYHIIFTVKELSKLNTPEHIIEYITDNVD